MASFAASIAATNPRELLFVRRFEMGLQGTLAFSIDEYPEVKQLFDLIHDRDHAAVTLTRVEGGQ